VFEGTLAQKNALGLFRWRLIAIDAPSVQRGVSLTPMVEPGTLLSVANELAAGASDSRVRAVAAVLAGHGALEALVNRVGGEESVSFNYLARFVPKWHDLC